MIPIRNVPDTLHRRLKSRAALAGVLLSDYLLNEIREVAERITVSPRHCARHLSVLKAYREADKALINDCADDIGDNRANARQFANPVLRRYFTGRSGADENDYPAGESFRPRLVCARGRAVFFCAPAAAPRSSSAAAAIAGRSTVMPGAAHTPGARRGGIRTREALRAGGSRDPTKGAAFGGGGVPVTPA